ncbi:MAG: sugar ABC transporter substrate-binding protein [Lachnospiraceae bacterium]
MKKNRITFLIAEICLGLLVIFFVRQIFIDEKPQKRVAVIVENSGDEKWDSFINGLKQAADLYHIHLIICNTDEIEDVNEEKDLIYEQLNNQVDGFIVQAAPGPDVMEMLQEVNKQKPVVLVANDVLAKKENGNESVDSGLPRIMQNDYDMGYLLGDELLRNNNNDLKGKNIGVIRGLKYTEGAQRCFQGLMDALDGSGCEIIYDMYKTYDDNIVTFVKKQKNIDYWIVLDTESLEQIGELYLNEIENKPTVYGVGNSMKCVYYLDEKAIDCLVMTDGYRMGYDSVVELAMAFEHQFYGIKSYTIDCRIIHKEDIFTEEMQQFLCTYE